MKKIFNVHEFRNYYSDISPKVSRIVYASEIQDGNEHIYTPMRHIAVYSSMLIFSFSPNQIYLRNGDSYLIIVCIKHVEIDTESSDMGTIITVVCHDIDEDKEIKLLLQSDTDDFRPFTAIF